MTRTTTEITEHTELEKNVNKITEVVIGCAIEVHRALGPGLLESAYETCLCRELALPVSRRSYPYFARSTAGCIERLGIPDLLRDAASAAVSE